MLLAVCLKSECDQSNDTILGRYFWHRRLQWHCWQGRLQHIFEVVEEYDDDGDGEDGEDDDSEEDCSSVVEEEEPKCRGHRCSYPAPLHTHPAAFITNEVTPPPYDDIKDFTN